MKSRFTAVLFLVFWFVKMGELCAQVAADPTIPSLQEETPPNQNILSDSTASERKARELDRKSVV